MSETNAGLSKDEFLAIVSRTPLVSIDIILRRSDGKVLVGKRTNRPAQGYWFVPGGRIRKGETIAEAFRRICRRELGIDAEVGDATLRGAYDHMYDDNYFGAEGITTHYVALGFEYRLGPGLEIRADDQHEELRWLGVDELLRDPGVHENTKRHFAQFDRGDPRRWSEMSGRVGP